MDGFVLGSEELQLEHVPGMQGGGCAKPETAVGEDLPQSCIEAGEGGSVRAHPQE